MCHKLSITCVDDDLYNKKYTKPSAIPLPINKIQQGGYAYQAVMKQRRVAARPTNFSDFSPIDIDDYPSPPVERNKRYDVLLISPPPPPVLPVAKHKVKDVANSQPSPRDKRNQNKQLLSTQPEKATATIHGHARGNSPICHVLA